jgi:hypothetical protein
MTRSALKYGQYPIFAAVPGLQAILARLFGTRKDSLDNAAGTNGSISIHFESTEEAMDAVARLARAGIALQGIDLRPGLGKRCVLSVYLTSQHGSKHVIDLIRPERGKTSLAGHDAPELPLHRNA